MKVEIKMAALYSFAALLALSGILFAALNCTLGAGAGCSLASSSPDCCQQGLSCSIPLGTCCIPSGSQSFSCTTDSDCCLGKCENSTCVSQCGCGSVCAESNECAPGCPVCAAPSGGGSSVCSSCILDGSSTSCTSSSQCCGGRCNPGTSLCELCYGINVTCSRGSDCCSGRCEKPLANESGRCAQAFNLSFSGGPCADNSSCRSSPASLNTLFCDLLNPNPSNQSPGVCRSCIPDGFACNASSSLCTSAYECRAAPSMGPGNYSLNDTGGSATPIIANWVKNGTGRISLDTTNERTGSACLYLESGGSDSYIYNSQLVLKNSSKYLLEFWYLNDAPRYAIYDANNDAYLSSNGGWVFSPLNGSYESPIVLSAGVNSASYKRFSRNFSTLAHNVSHVQVRLYPPSSGSSYVDDFSVTEMHDLSMLVLVKLPSLDDGSLFSKLGTENGSYQGMNWKVDNKGKLIMGLYSAYPLGWANISPSANISDADWHLAALTVDRMGNYTAYLDGEEIETGAFTLGRMNNSAAFQIGNGDSGYFSGKLDEVRFYQRALTSAEVRGHYIGNYQDRCLFNLTSIYSSAPGFSPASYNAYLRVRTALPDTVLYLPFDTNVSSDAIGKIIDYSPMLTPGTKSGARWTASGWSGGAYNFTSLSDNKITVMSPVLEGGIDFTLAAWIYPTSTTGPHYIMGNLGSANTDGAALIIDSGQLVFYAAGKSIASSLNLSASQCYHVSATRFRGNGTLYINGAASGSGDASGQVGGSGNFSIGAGPDYSGEGLGGLIDEPRAIAKALSAQEISAPYKDGYLLVNGTLPPSKMRG